MAKYAAKSEPRSKDVSENFQSCASKLHNGSDARSALRSAMIHAVGERDFSTQETAHMLLSLPLMSCTFSFATVSLTGDRELARDHRSGELEIKQSLFDHYATRTTHLEMSILQFASQFSVYNGQIRSRSSPVIVRTFLNYSSNPQGENYNFVLQIPTD